MCKLSLYLSLPVCRRMSLYWREEGRRGKGGAKACDGEKACASVIIQYSLLPPPPPSGPPFLYLPVISKHPCFSSPNSVLLLEMNIRFCIVKDSRLFADKKVLFLDCRFLLQLGDRKKCAGIGSLWKIPLCTFRCTVFIIFMKPHSLFSRLKKGRVGDPGWQDLNTSIL